MTGANLLLIGAAVVVTLGAPAWGMALGGGAVAGLLAHLGRARRGRAGG